MGVKQTNQLAESAANRTNIAKVAALFLRLGFTAFGGPAAHIAMMRTEVVDRRKWLSEEQFLDLLGATNLIPGPSSTEMAIYIGYRRAGWLGLVLAGICFILPAALIVSALAAAYVRAGHLGPVTRILYGVKPVIIAILLQAVWGLRRAAIKSRLMSVLGALVVVGAAIDLSPILLLFGSALIAGLAAWAKQRAALGVRPLAGLLTTAGVFISVLLLLSRLHPQAASFSKGALFVYFLKIGAILFGSGYVLLAFLRDDLVRHMGWLTQSQLLDAIAIGQVTPGPVFTTATFIGYIKAGPVGALIATVGIFLPSFLLVAASGPLLARLRQSPVASGFLDGVNVASVALICVVTWQLGRAAVLDELTAGIAIASAIALFTYRINATWLIAAGMAAGLLARQLSG